MTRYARRQGLLARCVELAKIKEIREGDTLTIRVRVARVSDDGDQFTIEVGGQRYTGTGLGLDIVRHEKGPNWPG